MGCGRGQGRGWGDNVSFGQPGAFSRTAGMGGKGCFVGLGRGRDKMVSLVWESCLFPNPSLSLSLFRTLKTSMAKDEVVSFAKLAVFFVIYSHSEPWNSATK